MQAGQVALRRCLVELQCTMPESKLNAAQVLFFGQTPAAVPQWNFNLLGLATKTRVSVFLKDMPR